MRNRQVSPTTTVKLFNLEQWISQPDPQTGESRDRKVQTLAYQIPYGMAKGLKGNAESGKHLPGTFFKIA